MSFGFLAVMTQLVATAQAAPELRVDSQELVVGQQVGLRVSIESSQQPVQPEIQAPDGLRLQVAGPPSFSTAFAFDGRNPSRQSTWTWVYALTALEEGEYTLGPATVSGVPSQAVTVRVLPGGDNELERLSAGLNVTQAYVGQTVIWQASFDTQLRGQPEPWRLPPLPGLELDPLVADESQSLVSSLKGQRIAGYRFSLPLRVAEPGAYETAAPAFSLMVAVRNQGRVERSRQVFTAPGQALVLLPQPSGQDARWSGLVGDFQISLEPERQEIALGETLSMTLRVEGDGSLAGWLPPNLALPGLKVFAEVPKLAGELDGERYLGVAERSFTVLPELPGVLEVPALELQILDPETGAYRLIRTQAFQVRVLAGQDLEPKRQSFAALEPAPPETGPALQARDPMQRSQLFSWSQPGVVLGLLLPALALLASIILRWPKRQVSSTSSFSEEILELADDDLAGAQRLLRQVQASLNQPPESIPSDPTLWADVQAARFGGGDTQALVERVRQALRVLVEGA